MNDVVVLIGAGSIGQAIARRVGAGKHIVVADLRPGNAESAADVLRDAGFDATPTTVDVSSRESIHTLVNTATPLGDITGMVHAAGVSPSQAPPATILAIDLYGTAVLLEEFGKVIAPGGAGVVIASQSGHRLAALTPEENEALATTPADELLALPMLQPDQVSDPLHAYQLAKRGNSLRVMAEAVRWARRGARVNTISPGIIVTPLARDELTGPRGDGYRRMLELSPAGRAGTPDEVATVGALLMGPDSAFITGSDVLMDGGVTASAGYSETMRMRWLPTLVLVPAGMALGHVGGYGLAYPDAEVRRAVLAGHGYLPPVAVAALVLAVAVIVGAAVAERRGRPVPVSLLLLTGAQTALFVALEAVERLIHGGQVHGLLGDPAIWLGLVVQAASAWWLTTTVRWAPRLTTAFFPKQRAGGVPPADRRIRFQPPDASPLASATRRGPQAPRAPPVHLVCCS